VGAGLRHQKDAIPGYINELWFRADEPACTAASAAELCGRDHGFMPVVVEVKTQAELMRGSRRRRPRAQASATPRADRPAIVTRSISWRPSGRQRGVRAS